MPDNIFQKDLLNPRELREVLDHLGRFFRERGQSLNPDQEARILRRAEEIRNYQPKVAVFGKTGSGKSSLCNAVFGRDVAPISDVEACTREPGEYLLRLSRHAAIALVDVPGVGESAARDAEYRDLYRQLLPGVDLLLWVLKADDRAYSVDEEIWNGLVKAHVAAGAPVFIVLNQVDRLNPPREWNVKTNAPGPNQLRLIEEKRASVCRLFGVASDRVIPVSAYERYRIADLVEGIVFALPDEKKLPFLAAVQEAARGEGRAQEEAAGGFLREIAKAARGVWEEVKPYVPTLARVLIAFFGRRR